MTTPTSHVGDADRPLRILFIAHYPLAADTGATGLTLRLAEQLRAYGHDVELKGSDGLPDRLGRRSRYGLFPLFASRWAAGAMRDGVDVVDSTIGDLALLPRRLVERSSAAVVSRSHGLEPLEAVEAAAAARRGERGPIRPWSLYYGPLRTAEVGASLRASDAALLHNDAERDWAVRHGVKPSRVRIIRNGLPPTFLGRPPPDDAPGASDRPGVVLMGPLMWRKGGPAAASSVARLLQADPAVQVTWLGADPAEVRAAVGRGSERVSVVARHRQDEVPDLVAGHQVLLFLSRFEGLPGSVLEAMACGLAVVASDIPAHRVLVEHRVNGLLVPPGDAAAAAGALRELFSDPALLNRLQRRAWERAQDYGWPRVAEEILAIYREIRAGKPRPG